MVCTLHPDRQKHDGEVKSDDPFVKAIPTDKRLPVMLLQVNTVTWVCLVAEFVTFYRVIFITEKEKNKQTFGRNMFYALFPTTLSPSANHLEGICFYGVFSNHPTTLSPSRKSLFQI